MERDEIVEYIQTAEIPLKDIYRQVFKSNGSHYAITSIRGYVRNTPISEELVTAMEEWYEREINGEPHRPSQIKRTYSSYQEPTTPLYILIERRNRARNNSNLSEAKTYQDLIDENMFDLIATSQSSDENTPLNMEDDT